MNKTNYLDIRIAIDMSQVLDPENVLGVKFMLGSTDETVVADYISFITERINNSIVNRKEVAIEKAMLLNVEDDGDSVEPIQESDQYAELEAYDPNIHDTNEEPLVEYEAELESNLASEDMQDPKVQHIEEEPLDSVSETSDERLLKLIDDINECLFEVNAFAGEPTTIYVKSLEFTHREIREISRIPEDIIIQTGSDIASDVVVEYKAVDGTEKTIESKNKGDK